MSRAYWIKFSIVLLLLFLGVLFVLPTILQLDQMPEGDRPWYMKVLPVKQLKLGLDLKGGIHMVLGVDVDKAVENRAEIYAADLREFLEDENIDFVQVEKDFYSEDIVVNLKEIEDKERLLRLVETRFTVVGLEDQDDRDLRYVFVIDRDERRAIERDTLKQALETLRNRVDEFGVSEPQISTQGRNRIIVQLPGLKDPQRARQILGKTAQLSFKLVSEKMPSGDLFRLLESAKQELKKSGKPEPTAAEINYQLRDRLPEGTEILLGEERDPTTGQSVSSPYLIEKKVLLTGEKLDDARVSLGGEFNQPEVNFRLNPAGAKIFEQVTRENAKRRLAIILDDRVNSAPVIQGPIPGGRARITLGSLADRQTLLNEARDLAIVLRAGALPAPVDILENRTVGPSLGSDSVRMGKESLIIGAVLVIFFMLLYYRAAGIIADVVLTMNLVFVLAILAGFQAVLTLPGIAGLVLTIGMAVDANIIIFERIREELGQEKGLLEAVSTGFSRAHLTILDANVTTLIAGFVLLQYGTGPVKGFAVTLIIGIITSYVTALWIARVIFDLLIRREIFSNILFKPKRG